MRRRKLLITSVAGLVGLSIFLMWPRPSKVTFANYFRITPGMSRAEVLPILGPPGDYRTGPTRYEQLIGFSPEWDMHLRNAPDEEQDSTQQSTGRSLTFNWHGDTVTICVIFDPSGAAKYASVRPGERQQIGSFEILVWRCKRLWRRSFSSDQDLTVWWGHE